MHVGTFVEFCPKVEDDRYGERIMVGRVTFINKKKKEVSLRFYPFHKENHTTYNAYNGYYSNASVMSYPGRLMKEVSLSTKNYTVSPREIKGFCWVMTEDCLSSPDYFHAGGMLHAYLLRYETSHAADGSELMSLVPKGSHSPFPVLHISTMPHLASWRIWFGLKTIKEAITKGLNRWSQKQNSHFNIVLAFPSPETFWYISHCVFHSVATRQVPYRPSEILVGSGLQKFRVLPKNNTATVLRFETHEQLKRFRGIFGATSLYGVRERAPTLKETHRKQLKQNLLVHYVRAKNSEVEQPFRSRTSRRGVDFRFDGISHLKISVRFDTYIYQTDDNGRPLHCPSQNLLHAIHHYRRVHDAPEADISSVCGSIAATQVEGKNDEDCCEVSDCFCESRPYLLCQT